MVEAGGCTAEVVEVVEPGLEVGEWAHVVHVVGGRAAVDVDPVVGGPGELVAAVDLDVELGGVEEGGEEEGGDLDGDVVGDDEPGPVGHAVGAEEPGDDGDAEAHAEDLPGVEELGGEGEGGAVLVVDGVAPAVQRLHLHKPPLSRPLRY